MIPSLTYINQGHQQGVMVDNNRIGQDTRQVKTIERTILITSATSSARTATFLSYDFDEAME